MKMDGVEVDVNDRSLTVHMIKDQVKIQLLKGWKTQENRTLSLLVQLRNV